MLISSIVLLNYGNGGIRNGAKSSSDRWVIIGAQSAFAKKSNSHSSLGVSSIDNLGNRIGSLDGGRGTTGLQPGNVITGPGTDSVIMGTPQDDIIYAGPGTVAVYGIGRNDMLFGGSGDDKLYGGTGNDMLVAGAANDLLDGGPGQDVLLGGFAPANDLLIGGSGNDKLVAGTGNNVMQGGQGADLFDCGITGGHAVVLDYNPSQGDTLAGNCKIVNSISSANANAVPNVNPNNIGLQPNES
jgi:Ca2+-binding RTX toxin-like protein